MTRDPFLPLHVQIAEAQAPLLLRLTTFALLATLVAGLVWACLAEIDVTVSAAGRVVTTQADIPIAALDGGVVKEIRVAAGDPVKAGQVLAVLDSTLSGAAVASMRRQWLAASAAVTRLGAERDHARVARFSPDDDEERLQRQLFDSRQRQYASSLRAFDDEVRTLQSRLSASQDQAAVMEREVKVQQELSGIRDNLMKRERETFQREGVNRINALEAQKNLLESDRARVNLVTGIASLHKEIEARRTAKQVFVDEWQAKLAQELIATTQERQRLSEELGKAEHAHRLTELVAPHNAIVLEVAALAVGSVVKPAEHLMQLVPQDGALVVDIDVPSQNIGRIRLGDAVRIKLDALNFVRYGSLQGTVRRISGDIVDSTLANGPPQRAYRVRVAIDRSELRDPPRNFQLGPGLSVVADIQVDRRVVITYFTYPILAALHNSMKEPL